MNIIEIAKVFEYLLDPQVDEQEKELKIDKAKEDGFIDAHELLWLKNHYVYTDKYLRGIMS